MKSISFKDKFEKQVAETINSNEEVRHAINNVVEDRFDRMLEEMRAEREENHRQWEENNRKWDANQKNINEILASIKIVEINHQKLYDLFTQTVGSLGARWGIRNESIFRQTMKAVLESSFGAQVQERYIGGEQFDCVIIGDTHILIEISFKLIHEFTSVGSFFDESL
jgi:hypothetical protein